VVSFYRNRSQCQRRRQAKVFVGFDATLVGPKTTLASCDALSGKT